MKPETITINKIATMVQGPPATGLTAMRRVAMTLLLAVFTATTAWALNEPPTGELQVCNGGAGFIQVEGWAADQDADYMSSSIRVDVYVYSDEACTSRYGNIVTLTADKAITFAGTSPYHKYSGNHGFETKIWINDPGNYWVKVIATDISEMTNQLGDVRVVTVSPVPHNITIANPTAGGTVESNVSSSVLDQAITLTAAPADGYVLTSITVTYGDNSTVSVTDGLWYSGNTASFIMPNADVTVTPTFTNQLSGLSVNMPVSDTRIVTVPPCVKTFKVYDDGGPDGDYSPYASGKLIVNAPDGQVIQCAGNITTDNSGFDNFNFSNDNGIFLIEYAYSRIPGTTVTLPTKVSGSNTATLSFYSNASDCAAGLDLTLTILPAPTGTTNLTQCTTSVPTHILWDTLDRQNYIDKSIIITNTDGVVLSRNIDYKLSIELENGETVPINYRYYDTSIPEGSPTTLQPGVCYNEVLVIDGIGNYTGTLKIPYKKFRLLLDSKRSTYIINNVNDFENFAAAVNGGLDVSNGTYSSDGFILGNNIIYDPSNLTVDLDGDGTPDSNFTPIGTAAHPFVGIFYGNGQTYHFHTDEEIAADPHCPQYMPDPLTERTISGIVCKTKDAPAGLFGCIGNGAKVSDVTLEGCTFTATGTDAKAGAVAAVNGGSVERCLVKNSTVSGTAKGAIVGTNSGTLNRNYYTGCNSSASNIGTAAGDVAGARRDVGLTVPGSLSLSDGTASGLVFDGGVYGGAGETLTFYEETFDAYTTTGPVASFTHDIENYKYALAIRDDAAAAINIKPANHFGTVDGADGSEDHPYVISTTGGLDFLSKLVNEDPDDSDNSRYKFKNKFFKLGADIAYDPAVLTFDLDGNGTNDSNFTPIAMKKGNIYHQFFGSFDGNGHTIRGIRVTNNITIDTDRNQRTGLFGSFGDDEFYGTLKNLTLDDAIIIGYKDVGGIVGCMDGGTITNCHVTSNVTLQSPSGSRSSSFGGIVGTQETICTVSFCTSAATIIAPSDDNKTHSYFGGIAGTGNGTISNNLVVGATVNAKRCGAIVGRKHVESAVYVHNYYTNCTVAGVANATGVGTGDFKVWDETSTDSWRNFDITENDGAVPVPSATVSKEGFGTYYISAADVVLPAGMKAMIVTGKDDGQALAYETIADGSTSTKTVPAGTAVMLQTDPAADKQTIGMTLAAPTDQRDFTATNLLHGSDVAVETSGGDLYYMLSYGKDGSDRANTLGWFWGADDGAAFTSAAHKAWLALKASAGARSFVLPVGNDNTTGIADDKSATHEPGTTNTLEQGAWYSLDGRKLNGRPTEKGVYIHNGRKEVIR